MRFGLSRHARSWAGFVVFLTLLCVPPAGLPHQQGSAAPPGQSVNAEAFRIQAGMHHELALLYLKNGEVDEAMAQARQIIQPPIPPEYQEAVAKSIPILAEGFAEAHRYDLAQTLLDETLKVVTQIPNTVKLFQDKSRLYLAAGENDKAIESWKRAKELETLIRKGKQF